MQSAPLPTLLLSLVAALPAGAATPQQAGGQWDLIHQQFGEATNSFIGFDTDGIGDVNGDGIPDYVAGASGLYTWVGSAIVFSGATHTEIRRHDGPIASGQFGGVLSGLGDLDGDGLHELAVASRVANTGGIHWSGRVKVFRGSDGSELFDFPGTTASAFLGSALDSLNDLNGDGVDEFIISEPGTTPATGQVFIKDGASGSNYLTLTGATNGEAFGLGACNAGDLNGDGKDDVLIASAGINVLSAYSAVDGALIWSQPMSGVGKALARLGDVNGDGVTDVIAGAPYQAPGGVSYAGSAYLVSGADGTVILQIDGIRSGEQLGFDVDNAGDHDGDLIDDFMVGKLAASASLDYGEVEIYSSADGGLIHTITGSHNWDQMGHSVSLIGDLTGDGRREILVSAIGMENAGSVVGSIQLWDFSTFLTYDSIGFSAGAGTSTTYHLDFPDDAAGDQYSVLLSASGRGPMRFPNGLWVPLSFDQWLAQTYLGMYPPVFGTPIGTLDVNGQASVVFSVPANAANSLIGQTFYLAAACKPNAELWRYASVSAPIEILP